jgi:7,8-dihydroneopterin aldolase/epimerase/oxygenase
MSSEIRLAFAHPSERAEASASDGPLDRISVRDHIVEVEIGAFQAERGTTQRICFNIVVEVQPLTGPIDDDVDRILSYDKVTEAISHGLNEERLNLLETLAARVADRILLEPQSVRAFVRIEKLDRGPGALGVEIVRSQDDIGNESTAEDQPHPRLAYLSNDAIKSDNLTSWISQMRAKDHPLILCVGLGDDPVLQTGHKMTQRRIDLLTIEQNAWGLAARDLRCVVVSTRTELDWAMKNGQICVWAPSKIVLDAVDDTPGHPFDTVALTAWFATMIEAQEMLVFGAELPKVDNLSLRAVPVGQRDI